MKGYPYRKDKELGVHFDSEDRIMGDEQFYIFWGDWMSEQEKLELLEHLTAEAYKSKKRANPAAPVSRIAKVESDIPDWGKGSFPGYRITVTNPKRAEPDFEKYPDMKHSQWAYVKIKSWAGDSWHKVEILKETPKRYKIKLGEKIKYIQKEDVEWR